MNIKIPKVFAIIALAFCFCSSGFAAPPLLKGENTGDFYQKVLEKAKSEDKKVMIIYMGLNWCGYCRVFDKNVLSSSSFKAYANKRFVILKLDCERDYSNIRVWIDGKIQKPENGESFSEGHAKLRKKYRIKSYPKVYIVDLDGQVLFEQTDYDKRTAKDFIAYMKKEIKGKM